MMWRQIKNPRNPSKRNKAGMRHEPKKRGQLRILRLIRGPLYWNMSHNKYKKSKDTDGLCSPEEIFAKWNWGKESARSQCSVTTEGWGTALQLCLWPINSDLHFRVEAECSPRLHTMWLPSIASASWSPLGSRQRGGCRYVVYARVQGGKC